MVNVRSPKASQSYKAPDVRLGRSQISLAHSHKTSYNAGGLIPYVVEEVVPGDTMTCKMTAFTRVFSPLDAPIMDDIEQSIDFFFVPNRLLWDNWEKFLGASDQAGEQTTAFTVPIQAGFTVSAGAAADGTSLAHYFGLPVGLNTANEDINTLPFRAYGLIYNEWYRDQNLIDKVAVATDNGPDISSDAPRNVLKSAKRHDYFTSALPYLQKGTEQSIEQSALVHTSLAAGNTIAVYSDSTSNYQQLDSNLAQVDVSASTAAANQALYANVSISINALREAAAIQRLLEKDARGGTRHPELIKAHFGVTVPDFRTQRPEYLGGGTGFVNVSPVANTSGTATENQGQLAGTAAGTLTCSWAKSFTEHGWVIGILRARGAVSYQQGVDRKWSRSTKYDYLWPELAQLGEQPIYKKELFVTGTATDDEVFGYQERYADYRFSKSLITGIFSSDATGSLDYWHLSEDFATQPALNQTFIEDQTPMDRVVTDTTGPDFITDGRIDLRVARILPVRPTPTLMPARF